VRWLLVWVAGVGARGADLSRSRPVGSDDLARLADPGIDPCKPPHDDGIVVGMRTDDYLSGPEDLRRRELVWGVVREPPSPFASHQRVTARITALLDGHVRQHDLGTVLAAPMDVVLDRERNLVVQPDVMFVSHARAGIVRDFVRGAPDLVVEVSSRGTVRYDRTEKVTWYRAYGVREYWLVDPLQGTVTVLDLSAEDTGLSLRKDARVQSKVLPLFAHTAAELLAESR
jgi:Uma2 family endonuclease